MLFSNGEKMKKTILLLFLCSFTVQSECHCHNDFETVMKAGAIGLGAAGAAGALYGGYKLLDWLFTRTDEQVIADVMRLIQETENYQSMDSILLQYHINSPTSLIYESCLYDLGYEKIQADYIDTYISKLYRLTRRMRSEKRELSQRMVELPSYSSIYSQMNPLYQQVQMRLPRIELLHALLKHHRGYYLLFEFESDIIGDYETELAIVQQAYDEYELTTQLKRFVMAHNTNRYPYMKYIQMIEKDNKALQQKISRLSFTYPERLSAAKELGQKLYTITRMLIGTQEYHTELQLYQKEQWERERIAMEREIARQERELERQKRLREKELYEKHYSLPSSNKNDEYELTIRINP